MAHSYLLLNTGDRLLLNDNSFLLLNAEGPSQVHIVGTHASQTTQRKRSKLVGLQVLVKAGITRRVQVRLQKIEKFLNPRIFSKLPSLQTVKIKQSVVQICRKEVHDIVRSTKYDVFFLKQKLKAIREEKDLKDPIFIGLMLREILKRLNKR